mmetsp:Transcript_13456/g.29175  ORF Transcript_13456/g.29175 Transcript_13456/m.29175 type:complete len:319 (+) Transcript_13456:41-997(+)
MIVRVRGAGGTQRVTVESGWTLKDLRAAAGATGGFSSENTELLVGFPPAPLGAESDGALVSDLLKNGDLVTVERRRHENPSKPVEPQSTPAPQGHAMMQPHQNIVDEIDSGSIAAQGVMRRVRVPDDNSCLFRSVCNVLADDQRASFSVESLRQLVADQISSRPQEFNEVILGKPPSEYIAWIKKPASWGGAIELSILSGVLGLELTAVDTQSLRLDRYGEGQGFSQRALLIYDGLHYDSISLSIADGALELTQFPADDHGVLAALKKFAAQFRASGEYTDTARFKLRCGDCSARLTGETEAIQHAKQTGHANFRENK